MTHSHMWFLADRADACISLPLPPSQPPSLCRVLCPVVQPQGHTRMYSTVTPSPMSVHTPMAPSKIHPETPRNQPIGDGHASEDDATPLTAAAASAAAAIAAVEHSSTPSSTGSRGSAVGATGGGGGGGGSGGSKAPKRSLATTLELTSPRVQTEIVAEATANATNAPKKRSRRSGHAFN